MYNNVKGKKSNRNTTTHISKKLIRKQYILLYFNQYIIMYITKLKIYFLHMYNYVL